MKIRILIILIILLIVFSIILYFVLMPQIIVCPNPRSQLDKFKFALDEFYNDYNRYPTEQENLQILIPYLGDKKIPLDPWGNPYIYLCPGLDDWEYVVYSIGKDGIDGSDDDHLIWKQKGNF